MPSEEFSVQLLRDKTQTLKNTTIAKSFNQQRLGGKFGPDEIQVKETPRQMEQDEQDVVNTRLRHGFVGMSQTTAASSIANNEQRVGGNGGGRDHGETVQRQSSEQETLFSLESKSVSALTTLKGRNDSQKNNSCPGPDAYDVDNVSVSDGIGEGRLITPPFLSTQQKQSYSYENSILEDDDNIDKRQDDPPICLRMTEAEKKFAESREPPHTTTTGTPKIFELIRHSPLGKSRRNQQHLVHHPPSTVKERMLSDNRKGPPLLGKTDHEDDHDESEIACQKNSSGDHKSPSRRCIVLSLMKRRLLLSYGVGGGEGRRVLDIKNEKIVTREVAAEKNKPKEASHSNKTSGIIDGTIQNQMYDHHLQRQEEEEEEERMDTSPKTPLDGSGDDYTIDEDDDTTSMSIRHPSFSFSMNHQQFSATSHSGVETTTTSFDDDDDNNPLYHDSTSSCFLEETAMTTKFDYLSFCC